MGEREASGRGEGIQLRVSFGPSFKFLSKDARKKNPFN